MRDVGKITANNGVPGWGDYLAVKDEYLTAQSCFNSVAAQTTAVCGARSTVEMRYEDGHMGCRDTPAGCPVKVGGHYVAYSLSESTGCMGPQCRTLAAEWGAHIDAPTSKKAQQHVGIVDRADKTNAFLQGVHQKDAYGANINYDRHFDVYKARKCCKTKCGQTFDYQRIGLNRACTKGCLLWIGHTNFNWIKAYETKLHSQCQKTCSRVVRGQRGVSNIQVAQEEEADCRQGCTHFHECSYANDGEMPESTRLVRTSETENETQRPIDSFQED
jgi:hypothetical protein